MNAGNVLIMCMLIYYSMYVVNLLRGGAKKLQYNNEKLDKLREKPIKTLEEQKEFLNLKYPKKVKTKKTLNWWLNIIFMIILTVCFGLLYNYLINLLKINISLWFAILLLIIFPLLFNIILSRFKLDNNDLLDLFKGGK